MPKGGLQRLNASRTQSVSSVSVQAPSSRMDPYAYESTSIEDLQIQTASPSFEYRHYDTNEHSARTPMDIPGYGHNSSQQYDSNARLGASNYSPHNGQQYAAQVLAGAVSLGMDVSPALQLSLADQHGSLRVREPAYPTAEKPTVFLGDTKSINIEIEEETPKRESYLLEYENGSLNRDLAGIGAQFEHQVGYCKYL